MLLSKYIIGTANSALNTLEDKKTSTSNVETKRSKIL